MPWAVCYSTGVEPEAYVVKGFLETQGIPCVIDNLRHPVNSRTFGGISVIDILVPDEWSAVAERMIRRRSVSSGKGRRGRVVEVDFAGRRRFGGAKKR